MNFFTAVNAGTRSIFKRMSFASTAGISVDSSSLVSWKSSGALQQTVAGSLERSGLCLHSGKLSTVKLLPEIAGKGRCFDFHSKIIPASVAFAEESPLCTTLCRDGNKVRTVEHLLSALEAKGVDNCRIQIETADLDDREVEVPIFDGSAREWVDAIEEIGIKAALDRDGNFVEKKVAHIKEPIHVWRNDSFVAAFPASELQITYGIDFPQVPAIGLQWNSSSPLRGNFYAKHIAPSRTFCVHEEVERIYAMGLIKGGSLDNAIVCSVKHGWMNPPLRFDDEPCRHKVLDLIGDLSLFAQGGNQGLPVTHIVAYKAGHALHADFVRRLAGII